MDLSFTNENDRFNYRVCAVIIHNNQLLVMKDSKSPYFYLPGGRVKMRERAEDAILREMKEELGVEAKIVRPLWLNQSFFEEDVSKVNFHELCLYFLIDVSLTKLIDRGQSFAGVEEQTTLHFTWLDFNELKNQYLYPKFIKEAIFDLPRQLILRTETD